MSPFVLPLIVKSPHNQFCTHSSGKMHSATFAVRKCGVPGILEATCWSQTVNSTQQYLGVSHYSAIQHINDSGCIWVGGATRGRQGTVEE